jgi:hypothetical protein
MDGMKVFSLSHEDYNFVCGSVGMWNLVPDIKGGIQIKETA